MQRAGATLHCNMQASHCSGFSCCGARVLGTQASVVVACGLQSLWLTGSRAQAQELWHTGLVAPRHVGSSRARARTRVPCIGRWILNHSATREALPLFFIVKKKFFLIKKIKIFGHAACEILVPQPGIEPTPPALEAQSLNHWTTREVPPSFFK